MVVTQNVDPARDGVFARMWRNRMHRYGSAAIVGAAVGTAGELAAKQVQVLFRNNDNNNNTMQQQLQQQRNQMNSTQFKKQTVNDDISNPF